MSTRVQTEVNHTGTISRESIADVDGDTTAATPRAITMKQRVVLDAEVVISMFTLQVCL